MMFIFATCAGLDEAPSVKIKDFHFNDKAYVLLHGKDNELRIVQLTSELVENLKEYLKLFHYSQNPNDYLFMYSDSDLIIKYIRIMFKSWFTSVEKWQNKKTHRFLITFIHTF